MFPGVVDGLATASLAGFGDGAPEVHLSLWHGFGVPLLLSALTLAGGALLAARDGRVQRFLVSGRAIPSGGEVYLAALRGLGAMSTRVTAFVQNGSLPVYAAVILATAALAPAAALLGVGWDVWPPFGPIHELPVAIILSIAAIGAAATRRRFSAAVFLSVAGYAMAGVFVLSGDPDLALTQVAVETLTTVVFVLVLRRLPARFEPQSTPLRRAVRLVIAGVVSVTVFVFALVAADSRITPPVSDEMVSRSVPDGHGRNVVNVILVDFRGFDTLGEVTVLAVASIGAVALARAGRRAARTGRVRAAAPTQPVRRLPFVDASVQVIFYVVFMLSLWLLFVGHNQPGGGFVGGLLAGSAITLRYVAGGINEVRARTRFRPWTVLGAGLLLAAVTAFVPLLLGESVLEVGFATLDLPLIGTVSVSSALAFDTGVYLVVVGVVLMAFEAFGDTPPDVSDPAEVTV
jgi:multicomponent Na+:H+ antiporter subunit A